MRFPLLFRILLLLPPLVTTQVSNPPTSTTASTTNHNNANVSTPLSSTGKLSNTRERSASSQSSSVVSNSNNNNSASNNASNNITSMIKLDKVNVHMNVLIPEVVLDLTYDVTRGLHLVLTMNDLHAVIQTRVYDFKATFKMDQLSIQDSLRCDSQKYLVRSSSNNSGNSNLSTSSSLSTSNSSMSSNSRMSSSTESHFITIVYYNINNKESPYYKGNMTEVDVEFSEINLNTDTNTVMHLRPFMEVLLSRKGPPPDSTSTGQGNKPSMNENHNTMKSSMNSTVSSSVVTAMVDQQTKGQISCNDDNMPTGMVLTFYLKSLSLDLLRPALLEEENQFLASAYTWSIRTILCDVDSCHRVVIISCKLA